ncbi:MAG TPA: ATP-binding protein [Verrucomicrobiae bacterium]|nr:ATP-binding protein [Verrucomicrobiae bacterium]
MPGPAPPTPALLRQMLACDLAQVHPVARAARKFLQEQACHAEEIVDIELALVEACNNAIKYARPDRRHKQVLVEARCDRDMVELRISDHTPGFDWPEQLRLPQQEAESGRGLFLIRAVMDEIHYERGGEGNTLVLRKKRAP